MRGTRLHHRQLSGPETLEYREEIWAFVSKFVQRPRGPFEKTLQSADRVILGFDRDGLLRALWAIACLEVAAEGDHCPILYLHYAYVDPAFRAQSRTVEVYLRWVLRFWVKYPFRRTYFAYTASTLPAYLLMTRNTKIGWPRPGDEPPALARTLLRRIGREVGLPGWDPRAGVVRRHGVQRYREDFRSFQPRQPRQPGEGARPDVAFYFAKNPGQAEGDSLFCLFPMNVANVFYILRRMIARWFRERAENVWTRRKLVR
jgi:hypothetical protein